MKCRSLWHSPAKDVRTSTSLLEVGDTSVLIENPDGTREELPFVAGFVCLGMRSVAQPYDELAAHFAGSGVELMNIGDSNGVGKIIDATAQGRDVLLTLERIGVLDA